MIQIVPRVIRLHGCDARMLHVLVPGIGSHEVAVRLIIMQVMLYVFV